MGFNSYSNQKKMTKEAVLTRTLVANGSSNRRTTLGGGGNHTINFLLLICIQGEIVGTWEKTSNREQQEKKSKK